LQTKQYLTVIGDVHGCYYTLKALLDQIPSPDNRIVLVGDIINKGKRSFETYQFVRENKLEMIMGNHELLFIRRHEPKFQKIWQDKGVSEATLSTKQFFSAQNEQSKQLMLAQMALFFSELPHAIIADTSYGKKIVISHAGISQKLMQSANYKLENALSSPLMKSDSIVFNRQPLAIIPGYTQIIGHQPTANAPINLYGNYLIDSGCVYQKQGMGYLSATRFNLHKNEPPKIYKQLNID
jgi:serine/threonine protein phosphatase 1